ncbi:ActS/PrrB/RegB family redox-sensitive histidine kinase [Rhodobacteraceae bacterium NNCM2]|nr:ActS/PrrB/RegB family redox-sensitive histidine kinase [Coraliihabitans acroporae]
MSRQTAPPITSTIRCIIRPFLFPAPARKAIRPKNQGCTFLGPLNCDHYDGKLARRSPALIGGERTNLLFDFRARGDWVRLRTLLVLRWMAICGQAAAVLVSSFVLGFDIPLTQCALLISASVSVNIAFHLIYPSETRLNERWTLTSLFFDLAQLACLLMVTGGLNNPFVVLLMAPVAISATALRLKSTIWLGLCTILLVPVMALVHVPLVNADGVQMSVPMLYQIGTSVALAVGIAFLALYVRRVTLEGYRMSQALNATQVALGREQRLAAIGGIAAATAHELGTPLATIKLVAGELARELKDRDDLPEEILEDVELIRREADRCRDIMADLGRGGRDDRQVKHAPIGAVIDEAAKPHLDRGKRLIIRFDGAPMAEAGAEQPIVPVRPELVHGLRNVIQNAVDFAHDFVWIDVRVTETVIRIAIGDDGDGFRPDILPRLGEPYVSSRSRDGRERVNSEYEGMGLGIFIARTLLERTGAKLTFANGSDAIRRRRRSSILPEISHPPGAIIEMVWPITKLAQPKRDVRQALGENARFDESSL